MPWRRFDVLSFSEEVSHAGEPDGIRDMPLLAQLSNNPALQTVDLDLLKLQAKDHYYSKKQKVLNQKLIEAEAQIRDIRIVIPPNTNLASLAALNGAAGVNFLRRIHNGNSTAAEPSKVQKMMGVVTLFEVVPPQAATVVSFDAPADDATYKYMSVRFAHKHVAKSAEMAQQRATERFNRDATAIVSTFLLSSNALLLNTEVKDLHAAGFFKLLNQWLAATRKQRTLTNSLIMDLVIRSRNPMQKLNCTQAGGFVAQAYVDYMYYCVADYPNAKAYQKSIVDHYVRSGELLAGGQLIGGYQEFDINDARQYSSFTGPQWQVIQDAMTVANTPLNGVRIYTRHGLIV